jgi:thioredoxin reductase (NADPH)
MPLKEIERKVVILGSGPAGLTAAIYASRAQLDPLVIDGPQPGGQLTITTDVENYPGFRAGIMGPILMDEFREQALRFGTEIINVWIDKVDLSQRPFTLYGKESEDSKEVTTVIKAHSLIISTGASAKWLGIPGEAPAPAGLGGHGVSACATCDGFFFRNKVVAVVGGGDTAMEEALVLTKFASKVYVIHRRDSFRASKIMQDRVLHHEKIEVLWNTTVAEVVGQDKVESLNLTAGGATGSAKNLVVDGLFLAIGHKPDTDLFKNVVELDNRGYVINSQRAGLLALKKTEQSTTLNGQYNPYYHTMTSIPGVFAAGDCVDFHYRQAATAAGMGVAAALDIERWLEAENTR